jgi:uncharacterized protein YgiM (DUF1202 family)
MRANKRFVFITVLFAVLLGLVSTASAVENVPHVEQRVTFTSPIVIVNTSFLNIRTGPGIQYAALVTVVGGTALPVLGISEDRVWYQVSTVVGVGWVNAQYVLPRGDFTNVPFAAAPALIDPRTIIGGTGATGAVFVPSDDTAVGGGFSVQREWGVSVITEHSLKATPSINGLNINNQPINTSIIYRVLAASFNEGVQWIQVDVPGVGSGWLEATKVVFRPVGCTNLSIISVTQNIELKRGPDGTGVNGGIFMSVGAEAYLLDRVGDLYKVELNNGTVGWIEGSAVLVRQPGQVTTPACIQSTFATTVQGVVTGGATVTGAGVPSAAALAAIPRVIINTAFLNIRSGPGAQYTAVATLAGGTELAVLGVAPDRVWYLVQGSFGQGWLNNEFVLFRGDGSRLSIIRNAVGQIASPQGSINRASVTLYAAPNLTLGSIGTLNGGSVYDVVARTADFQWVQVNTPLGFGWVQAEFITLGGDTGVIPVIGG